jgi:hypothetical protein
MNKQYQKLSQLLEFRRMSDEQRLKVLHSIAYKLKQIINNEIDKNDNVVTKKAKFLRNKLYKINSKINDIEKKIGLNEEL